MFIIFFRDIYRRNRYAVGEKQHKLNFRQIKPLKHRLMNIMEYNGAQA